MYALNQFSTGCLSTQAKTVDLSTPLLSVYTYCQAQGQGQGQSQSQKSKLDPEVGVVMG